MRTPIVGVVMAAALGGIAAHAGAAATHASKTKTVRKSGSVRLAAHERLRIVLPESDDGGYEWVMTKKPSASIVKKISDTSTNPCKAPTCVGGTVTRTWTYTARAAGKTSLKMIERRSFDKTHPLAKFTLRITVTG